MAIGVAESRPVPAANMKAPPASARVLIATDIATEGTQVQRLLEPHFEHLSVSSDPDSAVRDFDDFKPDVVVLAFDSIEKSQRYCLGLYRFGPTMQQQPHRTILLCTKAEVTTAFELCKKQYFDDYVLHWPMAHDGKRLPMSVWIASREILAARSTFPTKTELRSHAKLVGELENALDQQFSAATDNLARADSGLDQLERELTGVSEEFSKRLAHGIDGAVQVTDLGTLSRETERLKGMLAAKTHDLRERTLAPMMSWARNLRSHVEPALEAAKELAEGVRGMRPVIMVVDDDEMSQELLSHSLDPKLYDVLFASDSATALHHLQRVRPDAILMDIRLPGLDGLSFTRHLKAAPDLARIPIIMFTGDSRRETLLGSIEAGAADFIVKPFTRDSLNSKLKKVLSV